MNTVTTPQNIAIIGSTGSIGTQTLDIIAENPTLFRAAVLTARRSASRLIEQARRFRPDLVVIADDSLYRQVNDELAPLGIKVASGDKAISEAAALDSVDTVVTASVGYSGLAPTMAAIRAGKRIALANKETLVVAGALVTDMLAKSDSEVIPVDSEHSAIYQCIKGEDPATIARLIITASGGPFRHHSADQLKGVTPADALNHPNWQMGAKITIDSATMMNKAFEIIEARWLFGITADRIKPVIHPQSIIHSMVQYTDGAIKAQLGHPDMHLPISYALAGASRIPDTVRPAMELPDYASLTFEEPDYDRFPCLGYARMALEQGGNTACVINAANEIAVDAFLHSSIGFTDIPRVIDMTLGRVPRIATPVYEDLVMTNEEARRVATEIAAKL